MTCRDLLRAGLVGATFLAEPVLAPQPYVKNYAPNTVFD